MTCRQFASLVTAPDKGKREISTWCYDRMARTEPTELTPEMIGRLIQELAAICTEGFELHCRPYRRGQTWITTIWINTESYSYVGVDGLSETLLALTSIQGVKDALGAYREKRGGR